MNNWIEQLSEAYDVARALNEYIAKYPNGIGEVLDYMDMSTLISIEDEIGFEKEYRVRQRTQELEEQYGTIV